MSDIKLTNEYGKEAPPKLGLVDGKKHTLVCRDCNKALAVVWVVRPDFKFRDGTPYNYNYKAKCPYCNGGSEVTQIYGDVKIMPIVKEIQVEGGTKEIYHTYISDVEDVEEWDICLIKVSKGNTNG